MADQDPFSGLRTGPWVGVNNDPVFKGLADENTVVPGGVIEDQSITNAKIVNLNAEKIDAGTLSVTGSMKIQTTGTSPQLEISSTGTIMRDNAGNTVLEIKGSTTTFDADIINSGTINGNVINIENINATNIVGDTYQGLLIQSEASGVDTALGGVDSCVIFSGTWIQTLEEGGMLGTTSAGDAALLAPNFIQLQSEASLKDPSTGTLNKKGIFIDGEEIVKIESPIVIIGTSDVINSGDTVFIDSSGVVVNGGLTSNSTVTVSGTGKTALTLPDTTTTTGLTIGADTNLYRSSANTLKTDDDFVVAGSLTVGTTVIYGVPAGSVQAYLGAYNNIPTGWLFCNGSNVSRTTYAALFSAIGTTFGAGDGSTTFTLPNLFGHMLVGGTSTTTPGTASQTGTGDSYLNATWDHNHIHSHVTDPAATQSGGAVHGSPASGNTFVNFVSGGSSQFHGHSTNIAATTSDNDSTAMSTSPTQKRTRVNYIIKT